MFMLTTPVRRSKHCKFATQSRKYSLETLEALRIAVQVGQTASRCAAACKALPGRRTLALVLLIALVGQPSTSSLDQLLLGTGRPLHDVIYYTISRLTSNGNAAV
jgi:hypothetical protein